MFELCQKYLDYAEYLYKDSVNLPGVGLDAAVVVVDGVAHVEQGEGDHEDQPRRSEGQSYHNIDNLGTKLQSRAQQLTTHRIRGSSDRDTAF